MITKKLLIVEDDRDTRSALASLLTLKGYTIITAEDGLAGLQTAALECPDLVLTDIMMPHLDGIEMTRQLRAWPQLQKTPVIIITAYGEKAAAAIEAGATQIMAKPLDLPLLLQSIEDHLQ